MAWITLDRYPEQKAMTAALYATGLTGGGRAMFERTYRWKLAYELRRICRRNRRARSRVLGFPR